MFMSERLLAISFLETGKQVIIQWYCQFLVSMSFHKTKRSENICILIYPFPFEPDFILFYFLKF